MKTIYIIRNDIDEYVYIGNTGRKIAERFREHKDERKKKRSSEKPLYVAMNKYGVEHFWVEELEKCEDAHSDEREKYWIGIYKSKGYVYNLALGGKGKPFLDHEEIIKKLEESDDCVKISKEIGCSPDSVRKIADENSFTRRNLRGYRAFEHSEKIDQHDIEGNYIQSFESKRKAATWCIENNLSSTTAGYISIHIGECAKGKRKSAYGFVWKYHT